MTIHDWLMVTSIACLIVMTVVAVYLLKRAQQRLDEKTKELEVMTEYVKDIPTMLQDVIFLQVENIKNRLRMIGRIFSFIRRRREKRKLKKRMMNS